MKVKSLTALILCTSPILGFAHNISLETTVPNVVIAKHGEIFVENENIVYKEWDSSSLPNKVRVVQAIAGRTSAKKMNADLMTAITASKFPANQYQTTTIINQDDAIWGTGSFVKSSAEDTKAEFPWSSIILDKDGSVAKSWQLQEESSAIIVLNKDGNVLFVKEGILTKDEIDQVINLVSANL
ncbi:YtfJ family protein [Vibrio algarum]|uniref:YtfJ family protein n=1 Tax=Vibrio algarum TaxID=3020714 RepID=A0ABT4YLI0_9VIBR|nr:YtfJ family protein [Vibrio sp. KJ40-1]MDB1122290.1 YtfJ family protein [Vibrio sp. KJ40-1]